MAPVDNSVQVATSSEQFSQNSKNPTHSAKRQVILKRILDLLLSLALLPILLPVLGIVLVLIRLDSPGPIVFLDRRLGLQGRIFKCYKFRTMHVNNEHLLREYLLSSPEAAAEWNQFRKLRGVDPRVTRVGRVLRKLSLDELPQILNVLLGDMSLIGPRPYLESETELMGISRPIILSVRPGITGLWQVSGRNEIPFEERLRLESWYAQNWSLTLDLKILLRTVWVVLARRGAY